MKKLRILFSIFLLPIFLFAKPTILTDQSLVKDDIIKYIAYPQLDKAMIEKSLKDNEKLLSTDLYLTNLIEKNNEYYLGIVYRTLIQNMYKNTNMLETRYYITYHPILVENGKIYEPTAQEMIDDTYLTDQLKVKTPFENVKYIKLISNKLFSEDNENLNKFANELESTIKNKHKSDDDLVYLHQYMNFDKNGFAIQKIINENLNSQNNVLILVNHKNKDSQIMVGNFEDGVFNKKAFENTNGIVSIGDIASPEEKITDTVVKDKDGIQYIDERSIADFYFKNKKLVEYKLYDKDSNLVEDRKLNGD